MAADPTGVAGPTSGQARGPRWRRTTPGLFVPAHVADDLVEQRIVEQGMRLRTGAVTGWAALRLLGAGYADGLGRDGRTRLRIPIAAGLDRLRPTDDIDLRRVRVDESDVVLRHGVRCVVAERAVFDQMRWAPDLPDRVVAMDMAADAELTSIRRVHAYARARRHLPGRVLVICALCWADEHSRSPMETRLRLIWTRRAGWRRPLCNRTVLDLDGNFLGVPDLLDEARGVAGEFNGAEHRTRRRHQHDVSREDKFRRAGLEMFTVVGADVDDEDLVVDRMRAARARAGLLPRRWVVAPDDELCLDDRLDLRDLVRAQGGVRGPVE